MKTSPTTPRSPRKTPSTVAKAKAAPAEKAPRARRAAPKRSQAQAQLQTPSAEAVRLRAFEIFLSRNGSGDELSDWLRAEQELMTQAG